MALVILYSSLIKDNKVDGDNIIHTKTLKSCPVKVRYVPTSTLQNAFIIPINVAPHSVQHDGSQETE